MKTKYLFIIFLSITLLVVGCSEDSDPYPLAPTCTISEIRNAKSDSFEFDLFVSDMANVSKIVFLLGTDPSLSNADELVLPVDIWPQSNQLNPLVCTGTLKLNTKYYYMINIYGSHNDMVSSELRSFSIDK